MDNLPGQRQRSASDFAVAFDMDGLLVDTEPVWWRAEREVAESLGGRWTDADSVNCVGGPMEKVADIIIASAGQGERERIIDDVIARVAELLRDFPAQWLPGARELLSELSDLAVPVALVSASPRKVMSAVLDALGTDAQRFSFTVSADDVPETKPHPAPYLLAAAQFGVAPEHLVVFEDSPTGIHSAVASGAVVFAVPHTGHAQMPAGVRVLRSLTEASYEVIEAAVRHPDVIAP